METILFALSIVTMIVILASITLDIVTNIKLKRRIRRETHMFLQDLEKKWEEEQEE